MQQMFIGLGAPPPIEYTASNATNIDLASVFGADWTENKNKVYIIPSGVTLGASSTSNYAITVSTNMGGNLEIQNSGSILGYGGSGGSGGYAPYSFGTTVDNGDPGSAGGHAINIKSANVTVVNNSGGQISGGGGGGGGGGAGEWSQSGNVYWNGGSGGSGGGGQGYNRQGGPSGGSGGSRGYRGVGGFGGTGGTGGSYGQAGNTGSAGGNCYFHGSSHPLENCGPDTTGGAGGAAGKAIHSSNSSTWTATGSGTYHGSYT